jgi:hypothetical protein
MMELTPQNFRERILIGHAPKVTFRHQMIKPSNFNIRARHVMQGTSGIGQTQQVTRGIVLTIGVVATLVHGSYCFAGQAEVKAAEAIATTITYYEKCTGDSPSLAKQERLVKTLLSAGMTPQDFAAGSKRATTEIERLYPGRARPPQKVCTEVIKLYNEAFGDM